MYRHKHLSTPSPSPLRLTPSTFITFTLKWYLKNENAFKICPNVISSFSLSILKPPPLHLSTSTLDLCIFGAILLHLHLFFATLLHLRRHCRIIEVTSGKHLKLSYLSPYLESLAPINMWFDNLGKEPLILFIQNKQKEPDDATKGKDESNHLLLSSAWKIHICGNDSVDRSNLLKQSRLRPKVEHKLMVLGCMNLERRIVEAEMKIALAKSQDFLINNLVSLPHHLKSFKK
ncbi:unnamed protein product [Lactuca saligna]|uniref:Uncharacterized protein n=1 Tax=Lactuca saligna TaxID=75948 RepID=A0AA35UMR6_LACSI|nr:unnamed protein product [Lactuca saligna]